MFTKHCCPAFQSGYVGQQQLEMNPRSQANTSGVHFISHTLIADVLQRDSVRGFYQMVTRFSFGTNIGSDSVMPKASYQASMCGICPFTRHMPSWCGSLFTRF